jgi:uncharacterized phiE125 gp8 family phage protein
MDGNLILVNPPAGEPVTLGETKSYLRITGTQDDDTLSGLITAARQSFDGRDAWFRRALLTQTWDYFLPDFPIECDADDWLAGIRVPLPPLQSVTTVKYLDPNGALQTLAGSEYVIDTNAQPGRIVPAFGKFWPATQGMPNSVQIRFVAGYGTKMADVPIEIRLWLKQAVGFLYENREAPILPLAFFWTMAKYKVEWKF